MSIFVQDSFTEPGPGSAGLSVHTGELATWTDHPHVNYGGTFTADAATDRIFSNSTACYYANNWTPASADYYVDADFWHISTISQNIAICVRMHETDDTMYIVRFNSGTIFEMRKIIATVATTLTGGTSTSNVPSVGNFTRGRFVAVGNQLSFYVYIAGVLQSTPIIGPITDSSITAAGRVGVRNSGAASATTGLHLDNFEAGTLDAPPSQGNVSFRVNSLRPGIFKPGRAR